MSSLKEGFVIATIMIVLTALFCGKEQGAAAQSPDIVKKLFGKAIAVWHMDEEKGDIVVDANGGKSSANAYMAKIVNGRFNKGRYFDGHKSYITTPLNTKMFHLGLTISLWIKPEPCESDENVCTALDSSHDENNGFVLQSTDRKANIFAWYSGGNSVLLRTPYNRWTHLILIMDVKKNRMTAYLNGKKMRPVVGKRNFTLNQSPLIIGKMKSYKGRFFKGNIDEVVIWNHALEYREIASLIGFYNSANKIN